MNDYKKFKKNRLCNERREQRESMDLHIPIQRASLGQVNQYISLMTDPKTMAEGITGLCEYCSIARVVIKYEQSAVFLDIFQNFGQNPEIIEQMLILIEKILRFEEQISKESFSTDLFLQVFFQLIESPYSLNTLYYIAKPDKYRAEPSEHCAKSILDILNEGSIVSVDSLLSSDSKNLEMNIHFLSVFSNYESSSFVEFTSKILSIIVDLSQIPQIRPSVRFECLSFISFTLSLKSASTIYDIFIHKKKFIASIFSIEPNDRNERIQELVILNILQNKFKNNYINKSEDHDEEDEECDDFDGVNPASIVLNNDLFPFVLSSLKINMDENPKDEELIDFDVACYALDIIKEMAAVGCEVTKFLCQEEVLQIIFDLLGKGGNFYICVRSLMAVLEILMNSDVDQKNLIVQNGFFDILGLFVESLPSSDLIELVNDLEKLIEMSISETNDFLINSLLHTQSLMEQLDELSVDDDGMVAPIVSEFMMKVKSLTEQSDEEAS